MDQIATSTDLNLITTTMNMDLSAAFDTVPHSTLMDKLPYYGLDSHSRAWISSYLDGRFAFVAIGSAVSSYFHIVHCDTSRLFSKSCLQCGSFPMFADDGQFQYSSNSRSRNQLKLENCFWKVKNFLNSNRLLVNESKTSLTEFMTYQKMTRKQGIPPDLTIQ